MPQKSHQLANALSPFVKWLTRHNIANHWVMIKIPFLSNMTSHLVVFLTNIKDGAANTFYFYKV
jgi:hypothetical protein